MSHLIERFKDDLQLAGYAKRSTQSYVSSVLRLQRFYNKSLEDITEEELRQYWLSCQNEFGWSAASLRNSYAGVQHFFRRTLVRPWNIFKEIKWKREQTLPTVLTLLTSLYIRSDFVCGNQPPRRSATFSLSGYWSIFTLAKGRWTGWLPYPKLLCPHYGNITKPIVTRNGFFRLRGKMAVKYPSTFSLT